MRCDFAAQMLYGVFGWVGLVLWLCLSYSECIVFLYPWTLGVGRMSQGNGVGILYYSLFGVLETN